MLEPIPPGYRLECLSRFPPHIGSDDAPRISAQMMRPCSIQGFWDPIRFWIPRRNTFSLLLRTWPTSIRIPHQTTLFLQSKYRKGATRIFCKDAWIGSPDSALRIPHRPSRSSHGLKPYRPFLVGRRPRPRLRRRLRHRLCHRLCHRLRHRLCHRLRRRPYAVGCATGCVIGSAIGFALGCWNAQEYKGR